MKKIILILLMLFTFFSCKIGVAVSGDVFNDAENLYNFLTNNKDKIINITTTFLSSYINEDFTEYKKLGFIFPEKYESDLFKIRKEFYSCLLSGFGIKGIKLGKDFSIEGIKPIIPYKITMLCINIQDSVYFSLGDDVRKIDIIVHYHIFISHEEEIGIKKFVIVGLIPLPYIGEVSNFKEIKKDLLYKPREHFGRCKLKTNEYKEARKRKE